MAGAVVSFILQQLGQFLLKETFRSVVEERTLVKGVESDFNEIKDELESIRAFLKDADTRYGDDGGEGESNGVKTWVKQLREVSFRIQDVIDYYIMYEAERVNHPRIKSIIQMIPGLIKTMNPHHQIASEIQDIRLSLGKIKERSRRFEFRSESESGSYRGPKAPRIGDPRMDRYFIEETQVVGFEFPEDELVSRLVGGNNDLMLVSVVGMGGLGKTTLAKYVFNNYLVRGDFPCRAFITVSQSYIIRQLLTEVIKEFCKICNEPNPEDLQNMDVKTLITYVREYLESKRYLVIFDDVWKDNFSDEIEFSLINNKRGSRILVTTRDMLVAEYPKRSFFAHVHELQHLSQNKTWELFCNKAFTGERPTKLEWEKDLLVDMSNQSSIVPQKGHDRLVKAIRTKKHGGRVCGVHKSKELLNKEINDLVDKKLAYELEVQKKE